jgi:hypothetical protein
VRPQSPNVVHKSPVMQWLVFCTFKQFCFPFSHIRTSITHAKSPRIQVDLRYSQDSIEFLYFRTTLINGRIKTDLYTKDTDKHQYLRINSNHCLVMHHYKQEPVVYDRSYLVGSNLINVTGLIYQLFLTVPQYCLFYIRVF